MPAGRSLAFAVLCPAASARKFVAGKSLQDALLAFANLHRECNVEELRESALERIRQHPLQFLFPATVASSDGRVIAKRPAMGLGADWAADDNKTIHVPNGKLSSDSIVNVSHKEFRQEDITVGIDYDENIQRVREVLLAMIDEEEAVIRYQPIEVFVNDFKDSSIEMRIRFWVKTEDYWKCRWRTLENIKNVFDDNGITIPFNQLTIHTFK